MRASVVSLPGKKGPLGPKLAVGFSADSFRHRDRPETVGGFPPSGRFLGYLQKCAGREWGNYGRETFPRELAKKLALALEIGFGLPGVSSFAGCKCF